MSRPRRVRSPPFGYDPRMMARAEPNRPMPDFDDLYNQASFEGPPPMQAGPAFIEPPAHPHYPPVAAYRDHRLPSTYRTSLRDPQQLSQVASSTAPYKILCVTNINHKVSDGPVKDALTSDFSRFGDISVSICHDSGERLAYVYFKSYDEAREARHAKSRTLLFDRPIEIEPIYEPRASPSVDSPPQQPAPLGYPTRRRSITPSDYYGPPPMHSSRRAPPPPQQPMSHHRGFSPPLINYPHASRYPSAHSPPPMQPGSMPFGRYYMPPNQMPPLSPYSSPPHDQYRSYHPHPNHFPPGPPYNSSYGLPPAPPHMSRERDRPINEPHLARSPRQDAYYMMDQRGYPPPPPPMSHRPSSSSIHSSSSHHHHLQHHPNMSPIMHHHHSSSSSNRRSPPPPHLIDHPRYADRRESRREKFNSNDNEPEEGRPSRVLFATNVDPTKSEGDLRDIFESFGPIEDVEIRKVSTEFSSALIKFSSMDCAYKAKTATNGKYLGNLRCRLNYGKVNTSRRLWIGGLGPLTTMLRLEDEFGKFGNIINLDYISGRPYAYIEYESANQAQFATLHLRGKIVAEAERRIRIEFVDPAERNDKTSKSDSNLQLPDISSKSRSSNEPVWNSFDSESQSNNRKRSLSPTEMNTKRINAQALDTSMKSSEIYDADYNHESVSARLNSHEHEDKSIEEKDELNNNQRSIKLPDNTGEDHSSEPEQFDIKGEGTGCSIVKLTRSKSIRDIIDCCSVSWFVQLVLRNFNFPSRMFICSGNKARIEKYLTKLNGENGSHCPILRITQRWRLHPQPKLEEVKRRMQAGNLAMLVITSNPEQSPSLSSPTCKTPQSLTSQSAGKQNGEKESVDNLDERSDQATSVEGLATQSRPLKNLISYLEQKDAAGVISLNAPELDQSEGSKLLYAFPPGDFALNLLKNKAPQLSQECLKEEFLLGVIVGNTETKI